jgi:peptide/nickel transport system permease protein
MLLDGQRHFAGAPWLLAAPGAALLLSVLGFNLLGEGLRDALDPRESRP